jgi:teichuronic acid biosynthesis glycosyltransferase TuaG
VKENFNPKVSIITPTYNSAKFIEDTIKSVQQQVFEDWEHIIIDDCSSDNTVEIVEQYTKIDKRIRLIKQSQNKGAAEARNVGIKNAKGRYIAFLDSDDLWLPSKLKTQVEFMEKNDVAFSFSSYELIDEEGKCMSVSVQAPNQVSYEELLKNTIIGCLTVMLDTQKIKNIKMPNIKPEDTALWLNILSQGIIAYGIPENLAKYRIVKGSVSRNKLKAAANYWKVLRLQKNINFIKKIKCFFLYALNATKKNKKLLRF